MVVLLKYLPPLGGVWAVQTQGKGSRRAVMHRERGLHWRVVPMGKGGVGGVENGTEGLELPGLDRLDDERPVRETPFSMEKRPAARPARARGRGSGQHCGCEAAFGRSCVTTCECGCQCQTWGIYTF